VLLKRGASPQKVLTYVLFLHTQAKSTGKLLRKKNPSSGFVLSEKPIPEGQKQARKRTNYKSRSKREKAALRPRRRRRNPLVRAALEPSELLAPVVPDDFYETKAEAVSGKNLKLEGTRHQVNSLTRHLYDDLVFYAYEN